jgi:hypothetical protein
MGEAMRPANPHPVLPKKSLRFIFPPFHNSRYLRFVIAIYVPVFIQMTKSKRYNLPTVKPQDKCKKILIF